MPHDLTRLRDAAQPPSHDATTLRDAAQSTVGDAGRQTNDVDAGMNGTDVVAPCLRDLQAACPQIGSCNVDRSGDDAGTKTCFASGVTAVSAFGHENCANTRYVTFTNEVHAADGSLCYTLHTNMDCSMALEGGNTTWKNGHGDVVATAAFNSHESSVKCLDSGQTFKLSKVMENAVHAQPCEEMRCP